MPNDNNRLKVGIIGCGLIGSKRAAVIQKDPVCVLCAASDTHVANAVALLEQYGEGASAKASRDWRAMLDRKAVDTVIVATPNKYLPEITVQALRRGIHVLCEKPLGRNVRESEQMVRAAREHERILKTGFNHRHHPAIWKAHELCTGGIIGPIYFIRCVYGHGGRPGYEKEWRASRDICGGGEMLDQGVHVVDLFRWFMGDFEEALGYTPTCYWKMEVEDNAFAMFKTTKGQVAQMHTSWTQWKNRFTFEIFGEAGYLTVEGLGGSYGVEKLTIGKRPKHPDHLAAANPPSLSACRSDGMAAMPPHCSAAPDPFSSPIYLGGPPDEEVIVLDGPDRSWELEWREFTTAIREKREPLGSGWDGLQANRLIAAVYLSASENRPVKLDEI